MRDANYSTCHCRSEDNSVIEVAEREKGVTNQQTDVYNRIVFVLEGQISYCFNGEPERFVQGGQLVFVSALRNCSYKAIRYSKMLIFKLKGPLSLYTGCSIQGLPIKKTNEGESFTEVSQDGCLQINTRLHHFAEGIMLCLQDGIYCPCWMEMKTKELFILLKFYYSAYQTAAFLYEAANTNTEFSEHVLKYWRNYRSVEQMAASMNMTVKQLSSRFVPIFGTTPGKWIIKEKARMVYREITATAKPFKQIAFENGFTSDSLFTRFCKSELGKTPTILRVEKSDGQQLL